MVHSNNARVGTLLLSATVRVHRNRSTDLGLEPLLRRADGTYSGWDYAGRWVVLANLGRSRFCHACRCWQLLE